MESPVALCARYPRTPENTKPNGSCKECQRKQAKAKRTLSAKKKRYRERHPEKFIEYVRIC